MPDTHTDQSSLNPTRKDFEALLEQSFIDRPSTEGKVIKGRVVGIEKDMAIIDVGLKTEGRVAIKEFAGPGRDAELKIGDSIVMLADEMDHPDAVAKSPRTLGGVTSGLCLYVADCDTLFNRAVEAGGKVRRPLTNQFYGDRSGTVEDPFGQVWTISTHVEDVAPDELRRRMEQFTKG